MRFSISAPTAGGLSVSPAQRTIAIPANGRTVFPLTVSASGSAPAGSLWITATLSMAGGAAQTVKLAVVVGPAAA